MKIFINVLTIIRFLGALALPFVYHYLGINIASIFATFLFLTDLVDGPLARKYNASTFFGALIDVIADKSLGIISFVILGLINKVMFIPLIMEGLIMLFTLFKYANNFDVQTRILGKIKMGVLSMTVIISFVVLSFTKNNVLTTEQSNLIEYLTFFLVLFQMVALGDYIISTFKTPKFRKNMITDDMKKIDKFSEIKDMLFDHEFYMSNKGAPIKRLLYKK